MYVKTVHCLWDTENRIFLSSQQKVSLSILKNISQWLQLPVRVFYITADQAAVLQIRDQWIKKLELVRGRKVSLICHCHIEACWKGTDGFQFSLYFCLSWDQLSPSRYCSAKIPPWVLPVCQLRQDFSGRKWKVSSPNWRPLHKEITV